MGELYATETWLQIVMVTGVLGGGAAWLTGRAIAETWRPYWHVIIYVALSGAAVRFIHFALFEGEPSRSEPASETAVAADERERLEAEVEQLQKNLSTEKQRNRDLEAALAALRKRLAGGP